MESIKQYCEVLNVGFVGGFFFGFFPQNFCKLQFLFSFSWAGNIQKLNTVIQVAAMQKWS